MTLPPPSPALLDAVGKMKPVRTRSPRRTLAWMLAGLLLYAAAPLIGLRLRPDLPFLPPAWIFAMGLVWLVGFVLPLMMALLPRRGQVLPDGERALRSAAGAAVGLILLSALFPHEAPGHSLSPPLVSGLKGCVGFALVFAIVPVAAGLFASRRVVTAGSWRVGAAVGAGAGALGGLVLHLLCPIAAAAHVALAHGGAVVLCALLGALIARPVLER